MDILKIKAFLLIEKYKSFSKAAEEFSYTPSAISHMADSLEEELGIKLFSRTRRGVEITEEGRQLYGRFKDIIRAEEALTRDAENLRLKQENSLKIGAFSSIALYLLPEILQGFKQENPGVKVTIMVDDYMQGWLDGDVADVIFADDVMAMPHWKPLLKDEYVAVVPENEFESKTHVTAEELYQYPFIRPDEEILERYFDYSAFKELIPVKSIETGSAVYMVREGLGVTVLPELCMKYMPTGVRILRLDPPLCRTIGIACREKNRSFVFNRFIRHTENCIKRQM